jgi:tRNA(fMet)-specific endonuclease VapC
MKRYMLDTNTVSHIIKSHSAAIQHLVTVPMASLCMSAITEAELLFGLAKRPEAKRLHLAVRELLRRVDVLPWETAIASSYGVLRADMERQGKILASLDLLIAAHALSLGLILVTSDQAFGQVADLQLEDWTKF